MRISIAVAVLCATILAGCSFPTFEPTRAILAEGHILIDIETATGESHLQGSPTEHDPRWYLLDYAVPASHSETPRLESIGCMPWENGLQAAASSVQVLRLAATACAPGGLWAAQIVRMKRGEWRVVRSWAPRHLPYFPGSVPGDVHAQAALWSHWAPLGAASTNGRYIVFLDPRFNLLDTVTLRSVSGGAVERMFDLARSIRDCNRSCLTFTYNLSYLVVGVGLDGASRSDVATVTAGAVRPPSGITYDEYTHFILVLGKEGFNAAVPTRFPSAYSFPWGLKGIDESENGELLLLYARRNDGLGGEEYTIRDRNLVTKYRVLVRDTQGQSGVNMNWQVAWDAAKHRILFSDTHAAPYFPDVHIRAINLRCWDYGLNTVREWRLNVASVFRRGRAHYLPIR